MSNKRKLTIPGAPNANNIGDTSFIRKEASEDDIRQVKQVLSQASAETDNTAGDVKDMEYSELYPGISDEMMISRSQLNGAPEDWNFFSLPSKETLHMMLSSIATHGLLSPLIVWEQEDGKYMILSGHTREYCYDLLRQATGDIKYDKIACKVYKKDMLDEDGARQIIILSNIAQRGKLELKTRIKSIGELAKVTKKHAKYGSGLDVGTVIASKLGIGRTGAFFYQRINNLIEPLLNAFCEGTLTRRLANLLAGWPKEWQEHFYNKGYLLQTKDAHLQYLKTISSIDEIDVIAKITKKKTRNHSYRVTLQQSKPKDYDIIPIVVPKESALFVADKIMNLLNDIEADKETKAQLDAYFKTLF